MAWITKKPNGYMVRWRDAETGRIRSTTFRDPKPGTVGEQEGITARAQAEGFAQEMTSKERRSMTAIDRLPFKPEPLFGPGFGDPEYQFAPYLRRIIERDDIRDSSKATYLHSLNNHIANTEFGRRDIRFINETDVEDFWNGLDITVGARRNVGQLLRKAFGRALKRGLIDMNPLVRADISIPSKKKRVRGPIQVLEPEEVKTLASAAAENSERDKCIILVMAYGGLRAGEVGGLTRRDIVRRSDYCELHLHQQVIRTGREKYVSPLKTEAAQRSVPVPCSVVDELETLLKRVPPADDGRVFHGPNGELLAAQGINNAVQRAAKRARLGPINSHLLRHTAASMWFDDGIDAESVRQALGHSDIRTTLGLYAHMLKGGGAKMAASMERRRSA